MHVASTLGQHLFCWTVSLSKSLGFFCLGMQNKIVYDASQELMQKLAVEAFEVARVSEAHFTIQ